MPDQKLPTQIPIMLRTGQERIIDCESLSDNSEEICNKLKEDGAQMTVYLRLALYFNINRKAPNVAIAILKRGLSLPRGSNDEKVRLNNLLVSLYYKMAKNTKDKQPKSDLLNEAIRQLNTVSSLSAQNPITWVVKGFIFLGRNDPDAAYTAFKNAYNLANHNIPALFGMARIKYLRQEYKEALKLYQEILRLKPDLTEPDPRVGIGLCFNKLQNFDEAIAAFDRALELLDISKQYEEVGAHDRLTNFVSAMNRANKVLEINSSHSSALILLAHGFFFQRDFENLITAARRAEEHTDSKPILAEAHFHQARAYHVMEDYKKALYHYTQAINYNENHLLAIYGYGQMLIKFGRYEEAKIIFETLRRQNPNFLDVVTILAILAANTALEETDSSKKASAFEEFNKITQAINEGSYDNPEIFIVKAHAIEGKNAYKSLQALKLAESMYIKANEPIPLELFNKKGNLHFKQGKYADASECYREALKKCEQLPSPQSDVRITLFYNLARSYEASHNFKEAQDLYSQIINEHPAFIPARLRLAAIEEFHGNNAKANDIYNEILEFDENNVEVRKRLAVNQLRQGEIHESRRSLEMIHSENKHDIVASTALGSLYLFRARSRRQDKEARELSYKRAVEYFQKALQKNPKNVWAANGITVAIAESGRFKEAKEQFWKLKEHNPVPEITINYAHVCSQMNEHETAILSYEGVSKKSQHKDVSVLEWIGRSCYLLAKETKNLNKMDEALIWTEKALRLAPTNKLIVHNVALIQQSRAQLIGEPGVVRSSTELMSAIGDVEFNDGSPHVNFDKEVLNQRINFGHSTMEEERRKREEMEKAIENQRRIDQQLREYTEKQSEVWGEESKKRKSRKYIDSDDEDPEPFQKV
ncbi:1242_t:CDS:10 [Dentiscutata heterogama]|uniref:1242_t:CDS:1 n=1 Tax=Dentiscutata heterogama TaxID=1316150 RepID=A0ACA9LG29_9GLOM|nr:1242_t:CDS:10 [Dentiscutata heterogama]